MPKESYRVAVLFGGESPEREISLASGICVAAALESAGHSVRSIDPAEVDLVQVDWRAFDAAFIVLHGGAGEDGRIQQLLDSLKVPYPGSRPPAARLAMSKSAAKERFAQRGIATPRFMLLHAHESIRHMTKRAEELGYPIVVKPDAQGSSLGVGMARNRDELEQRLAEAQFYDSFILMEEFLSGREFTVAVLDREPLPTLEVQAADSLFSYDAKYRDPHTSYSFDTGLSAQELHRIESTAASAAEALGTAGLVRVDLRFDSRQTPLVLEVNTIPGLTDRSLAPRAAARAGIDMPALCDRLIRACLPAEVAR